MAATRNSEMESIRQTGTTPDYCNVFHDWFKRCQILEGFSDFYGVYLFICGLELRIWDVFTSWHQYSCNTVDDVISLALKIDANGLRDSFSPFDPESSFYKKELEWETTITLDELMKDNNFFKNGKIQETIIDEVIDDTDLKIKSEQWVDVTDSVDKYENINNEHKVFDEMPNQIRDEIEAPFSDIYICRTILSEIPEQNVVTQEVNDYKTDTTILVNNDVIVEMDASSNLVFRDFQFFDDIVCCVCDFWGQKSLKKGVFSITRMVREIEIFGWKPGWILVDRTMDKELVVINTKKRWLLSFVSMFVGPFELKPGWIIKIVMGEVLLEMVIHTAIVYYGVTHKSGIMVSSVDGVAKIKEGVCVQSIEHPGCDWDVKLVGNEDIVTACFNGIAYAWNMREEKWDKTGEVTNGPDGGMKRPVHDGVQYDYVFDMDMGDGELIHKLPYNRSDNAYDTDDKWLLKENLIQNTGRKEFILESSFRDTYTGSSSYVPRETSKSATSSKPTFKYISKKGMLVFDAAQYDGIFKKISEYTNALQSDPHQQNLSFSKTKTSRLGAIAKILKDTSHYHEIIDHEHWSFWEECGEICRCQLVLKRSSFLLGPLLVYASATSDIGVHQLQHAWPNGSWMSFDVEDSHVDLPAMYLPGFLFGDLQIVMTLDDAMSKLIPATKNNYKSKMETARCTPEVEQASGHKGIELSQSPAHIKNGEWMLVDKCLGLN